MESQVEEVKTRTDIVGLISGYVALKKAGRNYKGLCPFHAEKTGSFMVSAERGIFKCFGCGEGGDSLTFYQKIEGVEFPDALKALAARVGIVLKEFKSSPTSSIRESLIKINALTAEFYHYLLTKHGSGKKALEYLHSRGIADKAIETWQLGFAPEGWDHAFKFLNEKKRFDSRDIFASGVCLPANRKGPYDRFRSRIMFPIRNVAATVVGFSGRIFGEGEPKYLNSPDNLLFNKSNNLFGLDLAKGEIKKQDQTVLVEGNLDVISSHQIGVRNVVAPLGTALTEKQVELMRRFGENLIISFDQDSAGVNASRRSIELAENRGLAVKLALIQAKDPDELIRKSPQEWKKALKEAVSVYDYIIETTLGRYSGTDSYNIKKITSEVTPFLAKIDNEITRSHYERLLAKRLGVAEEAVRAEVNKKAQNLTVENQSQNLVPRKEASSLEKHLLTLIVQDQKLPKDLDINLIKDETIRHLLEAANKEAVSGKFKVSSLSKSLNSAERELLDEVSLSELPTEIAISAEKLEKEVATCLLRLKEVNLRAKLRLINLEIKQAEVSKNTSQVTDLTKNFSDLSKQLAVLEKALED